MKATHIRPALENIAQHRKEKNFVQQLTAVGISEDASIQELAIIRLYATASTSYACLWVWSPCYRSGGGKASGYGYHRASAAVYNAIKAAGFNLSEDIDGRGDSAIEDALRAIAETTGRAHVNSIKILWAHA